MSVVDITAAFPRRRVGADFAATGLSIRSRVANELAPAGRPVAVTTGGGISETTH